jgi:MFS family permease
MGFGMAFGVLLITATQKRIPKERAFCWSVVGAGIAIVLAASMGTLETAVPFVALLGIFAGSVYVLGYTIIQESVEDEYRGRVFASLYTLVRLCLLMSFAVGPLLAETFGRLSGSVFDGQSDSDLAALGVRLALYLAGVVILGAGALAFTSLRAGERRDAIDVE